MYGGVSSKEKETLGLQKE